MASAAAVVSTTSPVSSPRKTVLSTATSSPSVRGAMSQTPKSTLSRSSSTSPAAKNKSKQSSTLPNRKAASKLPTAAISMTLRPRRAAAPAMTRGRSSISVSADEKRPGSSTASAGGGEEDEEGSIDEFSRRTVMPTTGTSYASSRPRASVAARKSPSQRSAVLKPIPTSQSVKAPRASTSSKNASSETIPVPRTRTISHIPSLTVSGHSHPPKGTASTSTGLPPRRRLSGSLGPVSHAQMSGRVQENSQNPPDGATTLSVFGQSARPRTMSALTTSALPRLHRRVSSVDMADGNPEVAPPGPDPRTKRRGSISSLYNAPSASLAGGASRRGSPEAARASHQDKENQLATQVAVPTAHKHPRGSFPPQLPIADSSRVTPPSGPTASDSSKRLAVTMAGTVKSRAQNWGQTGPSSQRMGPPAKPTSRLGPSPVRPASGSNPKSTTPLASRSKSSVSSPVSVQNNRSSSSVGTPSRFPPHIRSMIPKSSSPSISGGRQLLSTPIARERGKERIEIIKKRLSSAAGDAPLSESGSAKGKAAETPAHDEDVEAMLLRTFQEMTSKTGLPRARILELMQQDRDAAEEAKSSASQRTDTAAEHASEMPRPEHRSPQPNAPDREASLSPTESLGRRLSEGSTADVTLDISSMSFPGDDSTLMLARSIVGGGDLVSGPPAARIRKPSENVDTSSRGGQRINSTNSRRTHTSFDDSDNISLDGDSNTLLLMDDAILSDFHDDVRKHGLDQSIFETERRPKRALDVPPMPRFTDTERSALMQEIAELEARLEQTEAQAKSLMGSHALRLQQMQTEQTATAAALQKAEARALAAEAARERDEAITRDRSELDEEARVEMGKEIDGLAVELQEERERALAMQAQLTALARVEDDAQKALGIAANAKCGESLSRWDRVVAVARESRMTCDNQRDTALVLLAMCDSWESQVRHAARLGLI